MFSYTGAFSVVAAQNALSTTSVDLANRSRGLTEENFGLNAMDPKSEYIYVMDTFDFTIMPKDMVINMTQSL